MGEPLKSQLAYQLAIADASGKHVEAALELTHEVPQWRSNSRKNSPSTENVDKVSE